MARDFSWLMPTADRRATIFALALPIIGGMVSQNVLNLIDTAMVGSLGNAALAGVGLGSFANFMSISFIMGLSSGVQAMAARRMGEGRLSETALPLNGGLLLGGILGLIFSVSLFLLAPYAFPLLTDDPAVVAVGTEYLQVRLLAVAAVGMNFSFRGYWNAINQPKLYMRTLMVMHTLNVVLNYLLIFGKFGFPEMGATGAAAASSIATVVGCAYYFYLAWTRARGNGFLQGLPSGETLRQMLRLAVPAGIERFFFSASFVLFFWIIGQIGTAELAAANVLINLALVGILPGIGFGLAAGTLAGQALGRKEPEDARRWGWEVGRLGAVIVAIIALPGLIVPELLLAVFIHDPATLELARLPLQLMSSWMIIDTFGMVLSNALLGVGASKAVMAVSVGAQWGLLLPLSYLVGPTLGYGLLGVWLVNAATRVVSCVSYAGLWHRGNWAKIQV